MSTRGIRVPTRGNNDSMFNALEDLREAVETLQGLRSNPLQTTNRERALAARDVNSLTKRLDDFEARLYALENP